MYKYRNAVGKFGFYPFFDADDGANGGGADEGAAEGEKKYSKTELNALVAKQMAELTKKSEADVDKKVAEILKQKEEEAKLSAEQLAQKKFEERQKELEQREREFMLKTKKLEASQALTEKGYVDKDLEKAISLINLDAENISQQIDILDELVNARVTAKIESTYKQTTPTGGNSSIMDNSLGAQIARGGKATAKVTAWDK